MYNLKATVVINDENLSYKISFQSKTFDWIKNVIAKKREIYIFIFIEKMYLNSKVSRF